MRAWRRRTLAVLWLGILTAPAQAAFSTVSNPSVPEPSVLSLMGIGVVGVVAARYMRKRRKK